MIFPLKIWEGATMSEQSERSQKINAARLENISTAMLIVCSAILFGLSPLKLEELSLKNQRDKLVFLL